MSAAAPTRRHLLAAAGVLAAGPAFAQPARTHVRRETEKGVIVVELADDKAPVTVANFLRYVDAGRLTKGGVFYRAVHAPGAPTVGLVEAGVRDGVALFPPIAHEPTTATGLHHLDGTLSMARFAPGTAQSDFSICCGDAPYLDAHPEAPGDNLGYAAFGQVMEGMDVARAILALPATGVADNPAMQGQILDPPVKILSARRV
jgi:peptidyl-prolyl cis-trans isomerase A (cyclophilin A)